MLAGMIFQNEPFFKGADNFDQLIKIAKVVGTQEIYEYIDKYGLQLVPEIESKMKNFKRKPWDKYINTENEKFFEQEQKMDEVFDLLNNMLRVEHTERITAKDSIQHSFFDQVRDQVLEESYSYNSF